MTTISLPDCTCSSSEASHHRCPAHGVDAPAEPITEEECPHCSGTGLVDDEYEVNGQMVGADFRCAHCDGEGRCPVDADGICAEDDCLALPRDQRLRTVA